MSRTPAKRDPIAEARRQWIAHDWEQAADGMAAVTSIMRAQQLLLAQVDALLKPFGLTFARFEVLRLLSFASEQRMTMRRAGQRLQVHPTSLTSLASRLAEAGFLRRETNPDDGRSGILVLTDAGASLVEEATAVLNTEVFEQIGLGHDDIMAVVEILGRFRGARGDFTA